MIRMKALRSFRGSDEGKIRRGREFLVSSVRRAKNLEESGLAFPLAQKAPTSPETVAPPPSNKASATGPLDSVGGEIGAAEPAQSSPPDHPPQRRRSKRSEGDLLS